MRKQFVECGSFSEAYDECPWANEVIKVYGGFQCFESLNDYVIWKMQN